MAAVGGARERPVGTRVGVVAASSDVIRLLPAKTSVSCAVLCKAAQSQDNSCRSELDSLDSLCRRAGAPMAETSPCNVDAAFSGAFQGDGSTAITPVAFDFADHEVRRWKESHPRRCTGGMEIGFRHSWSLGFNSRPMRDSPCLCGFSNHNSSCFNDIMCLGHSNQCSHHVTL